MARRWSELDEKRLAALLFENIEKRKERFVVSEKNWGKIRRHFPNRSISAVKSKSYKSGLLKKLKVLKARPPTVPVKEKKYYRFLLAVAYSSKKKGNIELRVWIHSKNRNEYSEDDLRRKLAEWQYMLNPSMYFPEVDEIGLEIGKEIEKEEIAPPDASLNEWFAFADFGGHGTYNARSRLGRMLTFTSGF